MSDRDYSPFGDPVWLTIRRAAWIGADPFYGEHQVTDLRRFKVRRFWFPHFSVKTRWFHFYIGWKPIFVKRLLPGGAVSDGDPKFFWWPAAHLAPGELAVQWSHRFGVGAIR